MAKQIRIEKVTAEVQRNISDIIRNDVNDSRVYEKFGSVTLVELTRDLQHAKIFISVYGSDEEKAEFMAGIESAKGYIRSELSKRVRFRSVPQLHFKLDASLEEGSRILSLLNQLKADGELGDD